MFRFKQALVVSLFGMLLAPLAVRAADSDMDFEERIVALAGRLDADVAADAGFPGVLSLLLATEFGTPQEDLGWAVEESMSWGHIAVLSYVGATTGRGFEELANANAHREVSRYLARMEMSQDRMLKSLEKLVEKAVRERNSRIFDRLRQARRFDALPDLGAGFGLFQEALDFRQIGPPSPTKVHGGLGVLGKGDGGKR